MDKAAIARAKEHFGNPRKVQIKRTEAVKSASNWRTTASSSRSRSGFSGGQYTGINPYIVNDAKRILEFVLRDDAKTAKVRIADAQA